MPYVKEQDRTKLDPCIESMVLHLKEFVADGIYEKDSITEQDLLVLSGSINYIFSRICGSLLTDISYPKIAIITGVLENIKQEFYRRVAEPYEEKKIVQNGDIKEYKKQKDK